MVIKNSGCLGDSLYLLRIKELNIDGQGKEWGKGNLDPVFW